ncbi:MAG: RHS repeat-associated core domain-containing protein [Hahellaceae bacterium]|nr:RHS repeat-associated core domain-containing protein [Hahellaceae bacterium]
MATDQSQAVVWQTEQTPFGEVTQTIGTLAQPLRFPGQYADPETGYSYNYFRDYDPSVGRYVQSDPIGLRGGVNTYGYVGGNPLTYVDRKRQQILVYPSDSRSVSLTPV